MPKNIIVCADGTGNKGGYTPDSNVYKIYKAIDKHYEDQGDPSVDEQVVFYDNGVGTQKNKILRALAGAFGLGFEDNVRDLYKFLAQNYMHGDRIYFFGFSRGASTVRACNGFIYRCGLARGKDLSNRELDALVHEAFNAYREYELEPGIAEELKKSDRSHGVVDIHFMGIWDTVVALGFPKRTDVTGPVSAALTILFGIADKILDQCWFWPHSFYYYRLTPNIKNAYQALAIDDERTSFWPFVWREKNNEAISQEEKYSYKGKDSTVEQVWFAGMHSNVGGGYGRSGMASVPLYWMMIRAEDTGLKFYENSAKIACEDSHYYGRMYNSRGGPGILYRYHPREIERLCEDDNGNYKLDGDIKIHRSVIKRLEHRTANYAPGHIPGKFAIVESELSAPPEPREPGKDYDWDIIRKKINLWVKWRKRLWGAMLSAVLAFLYYSYKLWVSPPPKMERDGFWGHLADILDYVLPDFLGGIIELAVVHEPSIFISAAAAFFIYMSIRCWFQIETTKACEKLRRLILKI